MATSKVTEHPSARAANPARAEEMALVERCRHGDLAAFEEDALAAEAPEPNPTPVPGQRQLHIADANKRDA